MKISYYATDNISVSGATLAVNATQYADHDLVGGLLSLSSPFTENAGFSIVSATIQDLDADNFCPFVILIFEEYPSGTTFTNNSALDLADADVPKVKHKIKIAASDYDAIYNTCAVAEVSGFALSVVPRGKDNKFYVAIMCDGSTPSWTASDVSLSFGVIADAS